MAIAAEICNLDAEDIFKSKDAKHTENNCSKKNMKLKANDEGAEAKSTGSVGYKLYNEYFRSGGGLFVVGCLSVLNIITQILFVGSDYWLSYWTNHEQLLGEFAMQRNLTTAQLSKLSMNESLFPELNFSTDERTSFVSIYSGITLFLLVGSFLRTILFFHVSRWASKNLHKKMLNAVLHAPTKFFETRPIGQILNRFTKDMGQVDDNLPSTMHDFIVVLSSSIFIIITIAYLKVWILIPTVMLFILFLLMRSFYIVSARDLKRIEGITRSPVFTHLSSTFQGLITIRALKRQQNISEEFDNLQDTHSAAWFIYLSSTRLFGIFLDILASVYIAIVTFSFMYDEDALAGDVGLGISMAIMMSGMFQWGVRQSAEVENQMTSVERIIAYAAVEPEQQNEPQGSPSPDWPNKGEIEFQNVSLSYNNKDPPVIQNLNLKINPAEKIGIVGRTGAGKTSLLSCIFRLTPPQGKILIDGIDTGTLALVDLRKSLSIIPQDPMLLSGTIRTNLDPLQMYTDEQLWASLEGVQMKTVVGDMTKELSTEISEGGSNLSVGQRQLLCLARTILKRSKILILDEPTANVDSRTDYLIQETIRKKFRDCTVLTIAHRLHTIMNSDKVMVLEAGKLMEFAPPLTLLERDSLFYKLVRQTGSTTANELYSMAKQANDKQKLLIQHADNSITESEDSEQTKL